MTKTKAAPPFSANVTFHYRNSQPEKECCSKGGPGVKTLRNEIFQKSAFYLNNPVCPRALAICRLSLSCLLFCRCHAIKVKIKFLRNWGRFILSGLILIVLIKGGEFGGKGEQRKVDWVLEKKRFSLAKWNKPTRKWQSQTIINPLSFCANNFWKAERCACEKYRTISLFFSFCF